LLIYHIFSIYFFIKYKYKSKYGIEKINFIAFGYQMSAIGCRLLVIGNWSLVEEK